MLVVGVLAVLLVLGATATLVGGYAVAAHAGRAAADLSALAGAAAMNRGDDACSAASVVAERNRAQLTECRVTGAAGDFVVEVTVEMRLHPRLPGLPQRLTQRAWAGVVP